MFLPCTMGNLFFYSILLIIGAVYLLLKRQKIHSKKKEGERKMLRKQRERQEKLDQLSIEFKMTDEFENILKLSYEDLMSQLKSRKLTAVQVLSAFMAKAVEATRKYNNITEFNPAAMDRAKELDSLDDIENFPLFGLPVCIKDDMAIKDMDRTMGYASLLYEPSSESAVVIKVFEEVGAIPFCKTNLSQTIFSYSGDNPTWGRTLNPLNTKCGPGGSSAGTGSLIASHGALAGIGSDLGGSVRIPSHFHGISALRPTINRLSGHGVLQCIPNGVAVVGVPGIMAKNCKITADIFKALTENKLQNKYDPLAVPVPFDSKVFESKKPLRIGYYTSNKYFPTLGDTEENVLKAKDHLESLGHTLVEFELPDTYRMMKCYMDIISGDQGQYLHDMLAIEPEIAHLIRGLKAGADLPIYKRICYDFISTYCGYLGWSWWNSPRTKPLARGGLDVLRTKDFWDTMAVRTKFQRTVLEQMDRKNLDLILSPSFPFPACHVEDVEALLPAVIYTCIYNFLDFPAGVIPFGFESGKNFESYKTERDPILEIAKESIKGSKGMPITVQLSARPFCEEILLRGMIETEMGKIDKK